MTSENDNALDAVHKTPNPDLIYAIARWIAADRPSDDERRLVAAADCDPGNIWGIREGDPITGSMARNLIALAEQIASGEVAAPAKLQAAIASGEIYDFPDPTTSPRSSLTVPDPTTEAGYPKVVSPRAGR